MRIGTWNMAGQYGPEHDDLMLAQDCDVWLLTEVAHWWSLDGYQMTQHGTNMAADKVWAAIASREPLTECDPIDPVATSIAAVVGGTTFVSSILPWALAGNGIGGPYYPWSGSSHPEWVAQSLAALAPLLREQETDLVWGGDWNHEFSGREWAGSATGRAQIVSLVEELGLGVATADLPNRNPNRTSIDHVALRGGVDERFRVSALRDNGTELSDHDMYVVITSDDAR